MNTQMLKDAISKRGLKLQYLAEKMGLSRAGLSNKINGKSDFNLNEIRTIETLLCLDNHEMTSIFFN